MLHIVAYDISDSRRLRRVARICEDYGIRVERSVFECNLDMETFSKFWQQLGKIVSVEEGDLMSAYPVVLSEGRSIKRIGKIADSEHKEVYIF